MRSNISNFEEAVSHIITHEELSNKKLNFLNMGAERVVFKVEGIPNKVFKIPIGAFNKRTAFIIKGNNDNKKENDRVIIEDQMTYWKDDMELEEEAKHIFGKEHFLERGIFRVTVPITKSMLVKYWGEEKTRYIPDDFNEDVRMLAESQEEFDVVTNRDDYFTIPFAVFLITVNEFCPSLVFKLEHGLSRIRTKIDEEIDLMKDMILDKYLGPIFKKIIEDCIKYTRQTGRMIDIFGEDNIVIFARKDSVRSETDDVTDYDYKFIELTMTGDKDRWMTTFEEDSKNNFSYIRHYYSYYYFIFMLGKRLGIQDNLELTDLSYFKIINKGVNKL